MKGNFGRSRLVSLSFYLVGNEVFACSYHDNLRLLGFIYCIIGLVPRLSAKGPFSVSFKINREVLHQKNMRGQCGTRVKYLTFGGIVSISIFSSGLNLIRALGMSFYFSNQEQI